MTTIKYSRPQNMKEISDSLRAMQAANDFTLVNDLIQDVDWLTKETREVEYDDLLTKYDELNNQYEELEQEQWGKDEYINELQAEIEHLEDELNDQGN
ncbi:hypothetical protein [Mammaliicoccus sciuri]|uniref:hypothetical protein n=1 Tax=Mammaliicoccus sciuri TaxID=1296 RepID=UPI002DBCC437|nr:hypothetical protein [Mammaliicoccus sciuri]MEB6232508.1 hypothetical protein [Mammaliicoccus sciuri]